MPPEKVECPGCGASVYDTDIVCMSCGTTLSRTPAQSGHAPPNGPGKAPPPSAAPEAPLAPVASRRRPRIDLPPPLHTQIVVRIGDFWNYYPWIGLVVSACVAWVNLAHTPGPLAIVLSLVALIWFLTYGAWVILDVFYREADWWWIPIAILFCYPLGFIGYLLWGRE